MVGNIHGGQAVLQGLIEGTVFRHARVFSYAVSGVSSKPAFGGSPVDIRRTGWEISGKTQEKEEAVQEEELFGGRAFRFRAGPSERGLRLSRCVAGRVEGLSVRAAKDLIDRGRVFVNNQRALKASAPVCEGQRIEVYLQEGGRRVRLQEEDILWEGKALVALNKPPGLLVYGTKGVTEDTVLPQLERLLRKKEGWKGRADRLALVHRLDKDTSGLLLVARNEEAASSLEKQFRRKSVEKRYLALVEGRPGKSRFRRVSVAKAKRPSRAGNGTAARDDGSAGTKAAGEPRGETGFEVLETFSACTLLEARPLTGHTHQVRVHLAQLGHPILGDILYGPEACPERLFRAIPRQMLHASRLGVEDPGCGERIELTAPLPDDMNRVLSWLRRTELGGQGEIEADW